MEFSSIRYFSFWSLISIVFSTIGIYALDKATIPGSEILVLCFVLSVSSSISYAFLFRPALEELELQGLKDEPSNNILLCFFFGFLNILSPLISLQNRWNSVWGICWLVFVVCLLSGNGVTIIILGVKCSRTIGNFFTGFAGPLRMYPYYNLPWVLLQGFFWLSVSVNGYPVYWDSLTEFVFMSLTNPTCFLFIYPVLKKLIATSSAAACVYQQRRFIEIVCGMLANTLAQYYFRVQSLPLMLGSLSLAIAWLGNLANVQPSTDFGIFQFLVTMSAQSAVSLYGLHFYTLLVVLAGIAMMVLRWKMESVSLKHFGKQERVVKDWRILEVLYGNKFNGRLGQPNTSVAAV